MIHEVSERAFEAFRQIDDGDDKRIVTERGDEPFAAVYHRTLASWVDRLEPVPPTALRIAARCQHLGRYRFPRDRFPEGLAGYKKWRTLAALEQEKTATDILRRAGLDEPTITRVGDLLMKRGLKRDAEVGLFEDAICLTFLELELPAFAAKHDDDKVVSVLQKTWAKMTERGHAAALAFAPSLDDRLRALVVGAVTSA